MSDETVNDGLSPANRIRMKKIQNGTLIRDKPKEDNDDAKENSITTETKRETN